uniref:Ribosomal protein L10e/L16 domain-containing protein n=1 Tax=Panagrolaimus sp. JU765 TaxID=591449 RepID=A0AC34RJH8_9BILA
MNLKLLQPCTVFIRSSRFLNTMKDFPVTFENVIFPPNGEFKLPPMPSEPVYDPDKKETKYKTTKRMVEARGVEEIHTDLIHRQYGLVAKSGGFISASDFKFIQERLNKNLQDKQFAIWRVDPPWLPRTKKAQGTKLGGGKGSISHYVTPVRANRIILELGGHITEFEARAYLTYMIVQFKFPVEFISEEILQKKRQEEADIAKYNMNRFNWDTVIKYNMQNCTKWLSQYDIIWRGPFVIIMGLADGDELLSIPFKLVAFIIAGLPLSALMICVILSMILHWDEATRTHCGVPNYLPSVSAAVASFAPERYIWRLFIGIHGTPRLALAFAFRNFLISSPLRPFTGTKFFQFACNVACFLNVLENIFLLLLTSISSTENYEWHKLSFMGFILCSWCFMVLSTYLFDLSGRRRTNILGERSYQYKIVCCSLETLFLFMAMYFFYRHNTYCEPFLYSLFALCEYLIIIFNICFHLTAHYDFHGRRISLLSLGSSVHYESLLPLHDYEEKRT